VGFNKGSLYDTNPKQGTIKEKSFKITILFALFDPVFCDDPCLNKGRNYENEEMKIFDDDLAPCNLSKV